MKAFAWCFASVFVCLALLVNDISACTTFCLKNHGEVLFGKNYDWMIGDGLIFVNKRGVVKSATAEGARNPAKWVSKYGSVTFNQYGRENPSGGMNEAGLVIELMWLDDTEWPKPDARPSIGTLEWIQYQLDSSGTMNEVIANSEKVRIKSDVKIHYLVNDKSGNTATIEYIGGKLVPHTGSKLPVPALTNDTYEKSLNYARNATDSIGQNSLDRFARTAGRTKEFAARPRTEQEAVDYAFDVLQNVAQKDSTQWSIVYDQKRGKIHFRTLKHPAVKNIDPKSFDYSCSSAVKMLDIDQAESGDATARFLNYSLKANRDLIERSFNGTPFLKGLPQQFKDLAASYPESFQCSAKPGKTEAPMMPVSKNDRSVMASIVMLVVRQMVSI
jgi:penicillin V acylase-like amidase (Ntn superfamily)